MKRTLNTAFKSLIRKKKTLKYFTQNCRKYVICKGFNEVSMLFVMGRTF